MLSLGTYLIAALVGLLLSAIAALLTSLLTLTVMRSPSLSRLHTVVSLWPSAHLLMLEPLIEDSASLAMLFGHYLEQILGHLGSLVDHDLIRAAKGGGECELVVTATEGSTLT